MASGTVTLDKAYFETILRRAQFHTGGVDYTTPLDVPTVTIPKADHDSLLTSARQYANLRRNLYRGGIAEKTLAVLITDDTTDANENNGTMYSTAEDASDGGAFLSQPPSTNLGPGGQDYTFGRNANYTPRSDVRRNSKTNGIHSHSPGNDEYASMLDDGIYDEGSGNNDSQPKQRHQHDKFAKRTILLANLPEGTTHADVVDVVRGGMLLDIYLRTHDRTASVSFLEEAAAQDFFRHVKRNDLYIRGKRVDIRWNDRQFILPGHVANKIAIGATRNLVIHNRTPKHTADVIRDDLEHIHNLVVIKIAFNGDKAFISTNSVHNAMFARTCMMSRTSYKGSKIEWDSDECAAPLEKVFAPRRENIAPKKQNQPLMNRFQLLNMDGEDDEEEVQPSGMSIPTPVTVSTYGILA